MSSENRQQLITFQQLLNGFLTEVVGALSLWVVFEVVIGCSLVVHRVGPQQVAKDTIEGNLLKTINRVDLLQLGKFRADTAVHRKIFLCDEGRNGK
jgi:hypothetical protein